MHGALPEIGYGDEVDVTSCVRTFPVREIRTANELRRLGEAQLAGAVSPQMGAPAVAAQGYARSPVAS